MAGHAEATARGVEVFTTGLSHPAVVERMAVGAERAGFDGMYVVDSQNLAGDPFVGLALAARSTSALRLGTGVTNPGTRHPVATAAGIASVHAASGGRALLGIGRGDSALAHLGLAPAGVDDLERYVAVVRAYLRGERMAFELLAPWHRDDARPVEALGLADAPDDSRLHWLDPTLPPVPVEVVATGPRMLDAAARCGDRVLLAVGADPERVGWAVDRVRGVRPRRAHRGVRQRGHPRRRRGRSPPRGRWGGDLRPLLGDGRQGAHADRRRERARCWPGSTAATT